MLAISPHLVRQDRAVTDYGNQVDAPRTVFSHPSVFADEPESIWDHSCTGARGDPSLASAEKGELILEAMTDDLVNGLRALFPDLDRAN
jgi:creatinine amidohydrolase